jgi:hypothetical protein
MPFVGADLFVIPGWPVGPGPEPMNTGHSQGAAGLRSWIQGSRAPPAPRNDEYLGYRHTLESGKPVPVADPLVPG